MKISLSWLKKYVDLDESVKPDLIAEKLSNCGFEVEEIIETGFHIEGVVIGFVESKRKHPDADKLNVCMVNLGDKTVQIVCGAPNVDSGQKVPVATVGTKLTKDFVIKKSKIRGEESFGMICSEAELGISDESDGIMVLDTDLKPGEMVSKLFNNSDYIFDLSITPNRADCLNHVSIARELAIVLNTIFTYPEIKLPAIKVNKEKIITIKVDEKSSCERYTGRLIRDVKIGASPKWLKDCLEAVGLRSINNLVDISNYVMLELGQPMHFYDYDTISDQIINIRPAKKDEKVITLDDKERILGSSASVVEDGRKFAGIAGVMGGKDTEVTEKTKNVFIEAAVWTQVQIQRCQRELNLITDASYRYSKGIDYNLAPIAQDRAIQLIVDLCGGTEVSELIDIKSKTVDKHQVNFRYERCEKLLGKKIDANVIDQIFEKLELTKLNDSSWQIPTYRPDLTREVDLIEEVARIVGLDSIEGSNSIKIKYQNNENVEDNFIDELKIHLASMGLQEVITNSMVNERSIKNEFKIEKIEIEKPVSDEMETMRSSLIPSLAKVVDYNFKHKQQKVEIFEINKDYQNVDNKIVEDKKLLVVLAGNREDKHWSNKAELFDFYDIKGLAESLLSYLEINNQFKKSVHTYSSQLALSIEIGKDNLGFLGEVSRDLTKMMKLDKKLFFLELSISKLQKYRKKGLKKIKDISKFPIMERDVAVLVDKSIDSLDMIKSIKKTCGNLLQSVDVFDIYSDKTFDKSKHSIAFKMIFADNRTLTDQEVDPLFKKVIENLSKEFNAHLREA
jgi:phenylalanyl-tRNA synthetase beta chain